MWKLAAAFCAIALATLPCAVAEPREPFGIGLEGFAYPYPVSMLPVTSDGELLRMAYMDVAPAQPNGRVVVLLHGRNFPASYWAPVIKTLIEAGYRVVVPDQIGFGKSSKPSGELHFDTLARNTMTLLDHLQIAKADIVAHSLGGMLAVRIARAFPDRIDHLLLAAPIGLEDYRSAIPPQPLETLVKTEMKQTPESFRTFMAAFFVGWPPAGSPPAGAPSSSRLMRSKISSRCTATSFGALTPIRTWLPLTPSTVTVTSLPIIRVSPTRLVKISISTLLASVAELPLS